MTTQDAWARTALTVGAKVLTDTGFAFVIEIRRDVVVMRCPDRRLIDVSWIDVGPVRGVAGDRIHPVHEAIRPAWDRLSADVRQQTLDKLEVVLEILTGFREGHPELARAGEPFSPFGPSFGLSPTVRAQRMADELTRARSGDRALARRVVNGEIAGTRVSAATTKLWVTSWNRGGLLALVDGRRNGNNGNLVTVSAELRSAAQAEVAVLDGDASAVSLRELHRRTMVRLQAQGHSDLQVSAKVGGALYRQLLVNHGTTTRAHRSHAVRRSSSTKSFAALRPGQIIAVDVTRADNLVWDPVGHHPISVEIFTAMDVCTRVIVAVRVVPMSADSLDLGLLLYDVMRPFSQLVRGTTVEDWRWAGCPELLDLPPGSMRAGRRVVHAGSMLQGEHWIPAIRPEGVRCDHGSIMMSVTTRALLHKFGIDHLPSRGRKPTDNAHLERWHETLQRCVQQLPGYKGRNVSERGRLVALEPLVTAAELQGHVRRWVALDYHRTPHSGIAFPELQGASITPLEYFDAKLAITGRIDIPQHPDLLYDFLPVTWATIGRAGVEIKGLTYDAPVLTEQRGAIVGTHRQQDAAAPFFTDPHDLSRIWFRDPSTGLVGEVPWRGAYMTDAPMNQTVLDAVQARISARGGNHGHTAEAVQAQIIRELGELTPRDLGSRGKQTLAAARRRVQQSRADHDEAQSRIQQAPQGAPAIPNRPSVHGNFSSLDDAWANLQDLA